MSDTKEKTKKSGGNSGDQPGKGQKFLKIFGRDSASVETKKEISAAKDRYTQALKDLAPWYDAGGVLSDGKVKTVGVLGWTEDEHVQFASAIDDADKAKKGKDFKRAGDIAVRAKSLAQVNDKAKATRLLIKPELALVLAALQKIGGTNPARDDLRQKAAAELDALNRGDPPDGILQRVQSLRTQAEQLATGSAPQLSDLEKERVDVQDKLGTLIAKEDGILGKLAFDTLPKGKIVFIQADVRKRLYARTQAARETLATKADKPGLSGDAASKDLQTRYTTAVTAVENASKTLRGEITKNGGQDFFKEISGEQATDIQKSDLNTARAQFLKDFAVVETALATLQDMGPGIADALTKQIVADKATILEQDAYGQAPVVIKSFLTQIATAKQKAGAAVAGDVRTLETDLATLRTELSKQSKAVDKRTKPAYTALIAELDQLDVIVATNNTAAFASARQLMTQIRAAGIGAAAKVTVFNDTASAIETVTSNSLVQKEFESDNNDILLAVKTMLDKLELSELAAAQKTFTGLKRDADALKAKADALVIWRAAIAERLTAVQGMIKEFRKLLPKVGETTFEQNAKQVKDQYQLPGVDRTAIDKLIGDAERLAYPLINNLQKAGPGQNRAVETIEGDIKTATANREAEEKKQKDKADKHDKLAEDLKAYKILLKSTEKKVKAAANGDTEELTELQTLGDQAKKKFKAGDEEGARSQLTSVRKRLDALDKTPGGVTAASVGELQGVENLWTTALGETRTLLDQVATAASLAAPAAKLKPADVTKRIDSLFDRFTPFKPTLVRNIHVLADEKVDIKQRKAAREDALKDVRAMRAVLDGDPMIGRLSRNPFGVKAPFVKLRQFLSDMEYNAMRAVPPE